VPILVVEDADAAVPSLNTARNEKLKKSNQAEKEAFDALKAAGVEGLYYLAADSIRLGAENMAIDGVHPNASGMQRYALAYEKAIRSIVDEPSGPYATMQPCTQSRDRSYDWRQRHLHVLAQDREDPPRLVILGNSIVQRWGHTLTGRSRPGEDSWDKYLAPRGARNFGFGGDRIENVLWRIYHGELDGYSARQVVLMIGTNNIGVEPDTQIVAGMRLLISQVRERQPAARLLVVGILPRREEGHVAALNAGTAAVCRQLGVPFTDPGRLMLDKDGEKIDSLFFHDGVHPLANGYRILARALTPYLVKSVSSSP
jgi:lysophospholipase L1-like esterase